MIEANKQIVHAFADAGNRNDVEEFKQFYVDTAMTFPDQQMTLDVLVAEGDRVAFRGKFSGTQEGPMGPFPPPESE